MQRFGYDCDFLTSDLSQTAREKVLGRVREGALRFLIATDVAARGIDLPELSHVIQYEPPEDSESYIHRSGRTGRAGASGTAITLVNAGERSHITNIGKQFKIFSRNGWLHCLKPNCATVTVCKANG
jgi:ATP-dependent RNA helicase DeaD